MLRVDRKQRGLVAGDLAHEDASGRDEAFLVGERGAGALPHGGERRLEACRAYDRSHHPIGRAACGIDQRVCSRRSLDAGAGKPCAKIGIATLIGDDRKLGPVLHGEFGETRGVAAAGQGHHRVRRWIAADEIERVLADRAGGAEHGDAARARPGRFQPDGFGMSGENGHRQRLTR